jgi:hypothetical protein
VGTADDRRGIGEANLVPGRGGTGFPIEPFGHGREDNDDGWDERVVLGVWGCRSPRMNVAKRGASVGSVREQCDMYGTLCGMGEKRGALEGRWRLAPRTNRVVVVVKGPEWTGDAWEEASGCVFVRVSLF